MRIPNNDVVTLLEKYRIHPPVTDERYLSHADLTRGVPLRIVCAIDPENGKQLFVSSGRARWIRACPLSAEQAEALVGEISEAGVIPNEAQELETLAHLLRRCSRLFAEEDLQRLRLAPVYIRRNDYRVGAASMTSASRVFVETRLDSGAHDKGAVFAHRPTTPARR